MRYSNFSKEQIMGSLYPELFSGQTTYNMVAQKLLDLAKDDTTKEKMKRNFIRRRL